MNPSLKIIIIFLSVLILQFTYGQTPDFAIPVKATGLTAGTAELVIGIHPQADYCIDNDTLTFYNGVKVLEYELPPVPPADIYDVRFVDNRTVGRCMGEGLLYDIRKYLSATQRDTFRLRIQAGIVAGDSVVFTWPAGLSTIFDSIKIGTSLTTAIRMDQRNRIAFHQEVQTARIWSFGAKVPPQTAPVATPLYKPLNNSVNLPPNVILEWYGSFGATKYIIEVATDQNFTNIVKVDSNNLLQVPFSSRNTKVFNLDYNTKYFWRVKSINSFGSSTSEVFNFTTSPPPPAAPVLLSPADNDTAISITPTLRWRQTQFALTYHLQVSTNQNFTTFVINDSTITDTSRTINLSNWTVYYWRVRAKNNTGVGPFSDTWKFKTIIPLPAKPQLNSPANNDTNVSLSPVLSWDAAQFASSYELSVALDPNFTNIVYSNNNVTTTSQQVPNLGSYKIYYWRVRGKNYAGTGPYSDTWSFKTILTIPVQVQLNSPANNSTGIVLSPTLIWNATELAAKYHYQVDTLITFLSPLFEDSSYTGTTKSIGPLESGVKYYWRVRAWNSKGYGEYSETWNFTTAPYPSPAAPLLHYPQNGAPNISLTPTLKWRPADYAEVYMLEVSRDSIFSIANRVLLDTNVVDTQRRIGPLTQVTRYFWRVRAKNKAGIGPYSEVFRFRTYGDEPASWLTSMIVFETAGGLDTLKFGVHPEATHGIDASLGEFELPPPIPGFFDVRWISPPRRPGVLGEGVNVNYLPFRSFTQIDTYRVKLQVGVGTYPITVRWDKDFLFNICDSMRMRDEIGGFTVNLRMDMQSSVLINNENVKNLLLIKWGARPLRIKLENDEIPDDYVLYPCYPNPFNPTTNIRFSIAKEANIELSIYNQLGEKIITLLNQYLIPGTYSTNWNGMDGAGKILPSGVYYIRLTAENKTDSKTDLKIQKALLIK